MKRQQNPNSSSNTSSVSPARERISNKYPPGPSSVLPGNLLRRFIDDPISMLTQMAQTYGEISHFKFGRQHVYLVNNPEYIEKILIKDHKNFIKSRGLQVSKRILGEGLITSEGDYHDKQRRIIQPAFHPDRIRSYGSIMINYADRLSEEWKDGEVIDIHSEMMHVASAIIAKSVLGSDILGTESDKVNGALLTSMEYLNRILMPFGELIEKMPLLPINRNFHEAKDTLDSIVYRMIREHRDKVIVRDSIKKEEGKKKHDNNDNNSLTYDDDKEAKGRDSSHPPHDLLYTLMEAQDPGGAKSEGESAATARMTDVQLRDEIMTIFLAGHETTANALTWTFYLLSQYPKVERRLYDEICTVVHEKEDVGDESTEDPAIRNTRLPRIEDVSKLEYTEKVFRESMRLYPPAWTLGRQVLSDYVIDKYVIPSGSIVLMSQYVMHHNPRYFSKPDTFDPDRWTKEFKSTLPRFAYFPFGGGIRGCVGEPFAWIEGVLVLATICRKWKMQHETTHKVELKPLITLRPKYGMLMKLERRR